MTWRILTGDALDRLRAMPDESVHCCVTSPPYWGLRDYGVDGQLGLEETPEQFVASMVAVFAEVRRVLRSDGTLWLNIGDSYTGSWGNQGRKSERGTQRPINGGMLSPVHDGRYPDAGSNTDKIPEGSGPKPKDLVGIPWMLAFALRTDGWYLRRDIIWAKPNPMPESVTDRPTSAHEYLFLLTKSPRYFYDAEGIREPDVGADHPRSVLHTPEPSGGILPEHRGIRTAEGRQGLGRNKRSVWTIATKPFPDAHFATFPPDLVEPCIRAGTSPKVCGQCGAPWRRMTETTYENPGNRSTNGPRSIDRKHAEFGSAGYSQRLEKRVETTGWEPTCDHTDDSGCAIVLDPFAGAATTGLVATQLGRDFVGIELNPEYVALGEDRIRRWEHDPAGHLRRAAPVEAQASIFETAEMPEAAA